MTVAKHRTETKSPKLKRPQPKVERWRIDQLKRHPRQDEFFPALADEQLQLLIDSIRANGQMKPVIIMADGTILSGHQTVRAIQVLSKTKVNVIVRSDIKDAESAKAMGVFLDSNLAQRTLGPLEAARILEYQLEHRDGKRAKNGEGELRDAIARKIGMTGRNLDRYAQLLDAPREVQDAVTRDHLPLQSALAVLKMTAKHQQRVVAAITGDVTSGKSRRKAVVGLIKRLASDGSVQKPARRSGRAAGAFQRLRTSVRAILAIGPAIASHATAEDVRLAHKVYRLLKEHVDQEATKTPEQKLEAE